MRKLRPALLREPGTDRILALEMARTTHVPHAIPSLEDNPVNSAPITPYSDIEWLLLTTPDDTEEAPWMTTPDFQWRVVVLLMSILRRHYRSHGLRWYLAAELKVSMPRQIGRHDLDLGPDMMMAEADDRERRSWRVAEEGAPPLFVLEVVTEESWLRDTEDKPVLYDRMGVREYLIFAPERKSPGPRLFGYHLNPAGEWEAWDAEVDGELRSAVLGGLRFFVDKGRLRVRDVEGHVLLSDEEAAEQEAARATREAIRAEQEAARAAQEAARATQEAARATQEAARADAAEAELRLLRASYSHFVE